MPRGKLPVRPGRLTNPGTFMKRASLSRWLAGAALLAAGAAAAAADDILVAHPASGHPVRAAADRVLVRLRAPVDGPAAVAPAEVATDARLLPDARLGIVRLAPGQTVESALRRLRALPNVLVAEPDYVVRPAVTPNDPLWGDQCGLRRIQLPEAWTYQRGRPDVTIAVLDSGVAYDHPDLAVNLLRNPGDPPNGVDDDRNGFVDDFRGWDFADEDNDPHADRGDGVGLAHGTHVAGLAAAATGNGLGIASAGWGCTYLPVRVVDAFGVGYLSTVARGIEYAVDRGCAVVNLSLEGPFSRTLQPAIDYAYERGVVVCAAAGNTAQEFTTDPATWTSPVCNDGDDPARQNHVLGVAAIDCNSAKLPASNYGATYALIDLTAPGRNATSTWWPGGGYGLASGTSQAAPLVAGGAALLIAQHGRLGHDAIAQLLRSAAYNIDGENPGFEGKLGAGRADVHLAVLADAPGPIVGLALQVVPGDSALTRATPGAGVDVRIPLRNLGAAPALQVRGTLTSSSPQVIVKRAEVGYGPVQPGQTVVPLGAFRLWVRADTPPGARVPLTLAIGAANGGPWAEERLALPVGWDALGEPDDVCPEAFPAQPGTIYERELASALDQDWFSFQAVTGRRYLIETWPRLGSSPATALSVREPACGPEALYVSGEGGPAQTAWVCPVAGRYSVAVTGDDGLWTGSYRFRIRASGAGAPGPVGVTRLAVDDDREGASLGNGDGRADPGETVEVRVELTNGGPLPVSGLSARLSTNRQAVQVLTADATFPDLAPVGAAWPRSPYVLRIGAKMTEPAQPLLTFAIASGEGAWTSTVGLPIGRSGVGEPDDECAAGALVLPDDFRHARAFESAADRDWFVFDASPGVRYRVTAWPVAGSAADALLALHGPACGSPVAFGAEAGGTLSRVEWDCLEAGRYGVVARPAATGAYALSVRALTNVGPGEPDGMCAKAVPLLVDGPPVLRDFGVPGDRDWLNFTAADGATYVIETGPAPGQTPRETKSPPDGAPRVPDTLLALYAPDCGAQIGSDDDGGAGLFSRLPFTAAGDGEYGVCVTEVDSGLGQYEVWARRDRAPQVEFTGESGFGSDLVQPPNGRADETLFRFRVRYRDPDGDPAAFVRVRLFLGGVEAPGSPLSLRPSGGEPQTGVLYVGRRTLPAGEYTCRAEASDGFLPALGPATAASPGPLVHDGAAAAGLITSLSVVAEPRRLAELHFTLAGTGRVSARILNLAGREVRVLAANRPFRGGSHTLTWDGATSTGLTAPPGPYLIEITLRSPSGARHTRLAPLRW